MSTRNIFNNSELSDPCHDIKILKLQKNIHRLLYKIIHEDKLYLTYSLCNFFTRQKYNSYLNILQLSVLFRFLLARAAIRTYYVHRASRYSSICSLLLRFLLCSFCATSKFFASVTFSFVVAFYFTAMLLIMFSLSSSSSSTRVIQ